MPHTHTITHTNLTRAHTIHRTHHTLNTRTLVVFEKGKCFHPKAISHTHTHTSHIHHTPHIYHTHTHTTHCTCYTHQTYTLHITDTPTAMTCFLSLSLSTDVTLTSVTQSHDVILTLMSSVLLADL